MFSYLCNNDKNKLKNKFKNINKNAFEDSDDTYINSFMLNIFPSYSDILDKEKKDKIFKITKYY